MCRLLGGPPIVLDYLLSKPEHSLIVQSYQPREMNSGLLNADGFGVGWYHTGIPTLSPIKYTLPSGMTLTFLAWGGMLSRDVCWDMSVVLRRVRCVDLSNCQPFEYQRLLCVHNGRIENFGRHSIDRSVVLVMLLTSQLKAVPTQNTSLRC